MPEIMPVSKIMPNHFLCTKRLKYAKNYASFLFMPNDFYQNKKQDNYAKLA